jgi:hypothetical protein
LIVNSKYSTNAGNCDISLWISAGHSPHHHQRPGRLSRCKNATQPTLGSSGTSPCDASPFLSISSFHLHLVLPSLFVPAIKSVAVANSRHAMCSVCIEMCRMRTCMCSLNYVFAGGCGGLHHWCQLASPFIGGAVVFPSLWVPPGLHRHACCRCADTSRLQYPPCLLLRTLDPFPEI